MKFSMKTLPFLMAVFSVFAIPGYAVQLAMMRPGNIFNPSPVDVALPWLFGVLVATLLSWAWIRKPLLAIPCQVICCLPFVFFTLFGSKDHRQQLSISLHDIVSMWPVFIVVITVGALLSLSI